MSDTTENLNLFKYNVEEDANLPFSITKALNNNWDIIDSSIPTKTSQLTNDSGFLTQHQDLSNYFKKTDANTISGATTFTGTTKVPNSATVGTAVSTAAISKAANGYIKFGNGIIIQWGYRASNDTHYGGGVQINFSTAFSNKNYQIAVGPHNKNTDTGCDFQDFGYISKDTTSFKMIIESTSYMYGQSYIAIGY